MEIPSFDPRDSWDPLLIPTSPNAYWSTDNTGEAAPGVLTPLSWSLWGGYGERTTREGFRIIGAVSNAEARPAARDEDRIIGVFYGRIAVRVDFMTMAGDRLPGTSGQEVAAGIVGSVPDTIEFHPTKRRYPIIAVMLPSAYLRIPGQLRKHTPGVEAWWRATIPEIAQADHARTRAILAEAGRRFDASLELQTNSLIACVQPTFGALTQLVEKAGRGDVGVLSGGGGAEMAVVTDIWRASRGEAAIEEVLDRHGFHGPLEGETSSRVWREDPTPLEKVIEGYSGRDDSEDPRQRMAEAETRLAEMQREVIAALPRTQRPGGRLVLHLAATRIPLRGVAKRSFLQALDVVRAGARRLGTLLTEDGALESPDDAFYFLLPELTGALPPDAAELAKRRRERRAEYEQLTAVSSWQGDPPILEEREPEAPSTEGVVTGIGVSSGTVEGPARVVTDPSFAEVEPDEILVAPTTDPSWSSIMFISAGLVVDIGGSMSHAAVVARELGLPCVVNTRTGTTRIKTGDRVRVDGDAGTVEVLERA